MKISIESPLDMHLHLRQGDLLKQVLPFSTAHFAGAVIMPNLVSPVDDSDKLFCYRDEIVSCCQDEVFEPYMTLFFRPYSKSELEALVNHIIGIKLYPAGITTGSESGVSDFSTIEETLSSMQELGIPLLVHGESDGFVMDRKRNFSRPMTLSPETFLNFTLSWSTSPRQIPLIFLTGTTMSRPRSRSTT